jgi:hypothetical protein
LIIGAQKEAIAAGLVSPKNLHASAQQLVRLAGYKDPDTYFTPIRRPPDQNDPSSAPIPPPADPKVQQIQMQAQLDQQADQRKAQLDQQGLQQNRRSKPCRLRPISPRRTARRRPRLRWLNARLSLRSG